MPVYPAGISVVAVEAGSGAKPEKAFFVLVDRGDLVIGQTIPDIQFGKWVFIDLAQTAGRNQ